MKTAKRFILSLSTLLLVSGLAMSAPASARDTTSGGTGTSGSHDTAPVAAASSTDSTTGTQTKTEVENHAKDLTEQFKIKAQTELTQKKTQVKEHTKEEKQKSCNEHKTDITNRMAKTVARAKTHKETLDKIYTKVVDYYTTKNLTVANYDSLKASVDAAQANAAANITALESVNVTIDCTSQTAAQDVSTFKQAVTTTRDSLKAYRTALKDLITAIKGASGSTDQPNSTDKTNNQVNQ